MQEPGLSMLVAAGLQSLDFVSSRTVRGVASQRDMMSVMAVWCTRHRDAIAATVDTCRIRIPIDVSGRCTNPGNCQGDSENSGRKQ